MNAGVTSTMSSVSVPVSVQRALRTALTLILGVALSVTGVFIAAPAQAETGVALPGTVAFGGPDYLGSGVGPSSMAITNTGNFAYLNDYVGDAVREVDLSTGSTARSWTISTPTSVALDPVANAYLIVAHGSTAGYSRILLSDGVVSTHSLTTGSDPYYVAIDATSTYAYFAERVAKRIEKVQLSTNTVVGSLTLTSEPSALAITPDGASLYAASFSGNSVSKITTSDLSLSVTYPLTNTNPVNIAVTPDGTQILLTHATGAKMTRIDTGTGAMQLLTIGLTGRAISLAIDPYSTFAYVGSYGRDVVKVDLRTGASVPFTAFPGDINPETTAIAFPTSGGQVAKYAYLAVVSASKIAKISISPYAPTPVTGTRGNALVNLSWTVPTYPGADPITDYSIEYSTNNSTWTAFPHTASIATSLAVTGLTNGTPYYFRVAAISAAGTGLYANLVGTLTPATVPGPPTSVTATTSNGQLTLNWVAPTSNGGESITDYLVETSTDNTNWSVVAHSPSTATSLVVTGLINGTPYYFRVAAINAVGTSAYGTGGPISPTSGGGGGGTPTAPEPEATVTVTVTESQPSPALSSTPAASTPPALVITPSIASARVIYRQRSDTRWEVVPRFRKAAKTIPSKALFTVVRSPIAGQSKNIPAAVSRGKALAEAHAGSAHTSVLKGKLWRGRARIIVNW
jgi:DNA-binding beta-propeller fold protein YncE